jgi:hypothetical protein
MAREMSYDAVRTEADLGQLRQLADDLEALVNVARTCAVTGSRPTERLTALSEQVAGALAFLGIAAPDYGPALIEPLRGDGPLAVPVRAAGGVVVEGGVLETWCSGYRVLLAGVRGRVKALEAAAGPRERSERG